MININLIAERRAQRIREMRYLQGAGLGVVVLLVLMVGLNVTAMVTRQALKNDIVTINSELKKLEDDQETLNQIVAKIEERRPLVTLLDHVRISEGVWMTILADTSDIIPDDVVLRGFNAGARKDGISIRLAGVAKDQKTVGDFMLALSEKTRWADKPIPGPIALEASTNNGSRVRFDLTVPVRDLLGGEL